MPLKKECRLSSCVKEVQCPRKLIERYLATVDGWY